MIAEYYDALYIGGTKVGALYGKAVVFTKNHMPPYFMTTVKQRGTLLAKDRLLGIRFDTLFTDDLYSKIGRHATEIAELLKDGFHRKNCAFAWGSPTNQQSIVLQNSVMQKLQEKVAFSFWEKADEGHTVVRFATSWTTKEDDITRLAEMLE